MNQRLKYIIVLMLGAVLASCSKEPASPDDEGPAQGTATLAVVCELPAGGGTRSVTNPDPGDGTEPGSDGGTENGTQAESTIGTGLVVLGSILPGSSSPSTVHSTYEIERFYPLTDGRWWCELKVPPGKYRVLLIANPNALIDRKRVDAGARWDEVTALNLTAAAYADLTTLWQDNEFLMCNAFTGHTALPDVTLEARGRKEINVSLERLCARFDYAAKAGTPNTYTMQGQLSGGTAANITVTLTHAGLMNVSRGFHLCKSVCDDERGLSPTVYGYEHSLNYVYDTDWAAKRTVTAADPQLETMFFYGSENNTPAISYVALPTSETYSRMFYCSENTIPGIARQINMLSTAVVFKGHFSVGGLDAATTTIYTDAAAIYTSAAELTAAHSSLSAASTDAELAAAGVKRFIRDAAGFPVWYTYWNRHNDNNKPLQMGIMEFATVRNNVYKLQVNSISTLGLPAEPGGDNPWQPAGDTPDEQGPQMDVKVSVSAWVNRVYDHEI